MAKILGKDQATYSKEREGFLRDLQHFHEIRGTPFKRPPTLGGKEVDLFLLYTLVTSQGGWIRVNSKNSWTEILPFLKLPASCVNGSVALKQIYLRYLDRWEKVHFLHEEADRGSDDDEESRHKRWSARALHSVPCNYNYGQHNVIDNNREYNRLATNVYKPSDYDRLALSLISPLPNEQDFAINVCTLLSNDGKHTLKLEKHPRIVNYLLGHAGIFNHSSLRQLFVHFYSNIRKKPIHTFWKDVLESQEYLDLTDETAFVAKTDGVPSNKIESTNNSVECALNQQQEQVPMDIVVEQDRLNVTVTEEDTLCGGSGSTESSDCELVVDNSDCCDSDQSGGLFCLKRSLGTQDYVGQRVLQIATILRNLTFVEDNVPVLVKNTTFLRFVLLCSTSHWNTLKNLGMDMMCNMAPEYIVKDFHDDRLTSNLMKIISDGLRSDDRAACLSALDVLNKLSQNECNEDVLLRSLQSHVYKCVCSFLTIHDVMLLIYTLECLYSLSSLGERSCTFIVNNHGVIDTLVSLVTVEGKSYGPKSCIGMKLVETLSSSSGQQHQQSSAAAAVSTTATVTTTSSTVVASCSVASPTPVMMMTSSMTSSTVTPVVSVSPTPKVSVMASTPVRPVQIAPQRLIPITPTSSTSISLTTVSHANSSMTPQQLIQQQHAHQQAIHENEQFALSWLRATYEPSVNGKIDHQELYKHYMNSCSKIGRRGVISPLHFPRCVRSVFGGTVGPNPMKPTNPSDPQYYEGIKVRDNPLIITIPSSIATLTKTTSNTLTVKSQQQVRRKSVQPVVVVNVTPTRPLSASSLSSSQADISAIEGEGDGVPMSPASPILKAQLSAPPKQREVSGGGGGGGDCGIICPSPNTSKGDTKSQAMSHPHLSQALLGGTTATTITTSTNAVATSVVANSKENQVGQTSNTSLIKSLLATKVAARQQRLLAQQTGTTTPDAKKDNVPKTATITSRLNGVRQLMFADEEIGDPSVSSTTPFAAGTTKGKKEPPQPPPPPPPPLAPLTNNLMVKGGKTQRIDNDDSDSIGKDSLASSSGMGTVGIGGVSSTEDGDNSLTSFEGLLNGIPNIDNPLNEDSNSKDSVKLISSGEITIDKPLRLADLLEKKFEKSPPMLMNGTLGKELRRGGEKTLDLVENHIEKALLSRESINNQQQSLKRAASEELNEIEPKKPALASNVNGSSLMVDSPAPDSVSSSNGEEGPSTVSTAAAKLFADIAADILEDEDEEQLMQEAQHQQLIDTAAAAATTQVQAAQGSALQQIIVDNNQHQQQQQVLLTQQRQIIVSQAQMQTSNQVVFSAGSQLKTQSGQTVIVQNTSAQRPVMLQQSNTGQFLLSQGLQGQMQLVASSQPGQYVLQASGTQNTYVVAQPQTAVVHGQQQTVLVAQTSQQQGTGAKTIIILQQQPSNATTATHHQKVVVTPQGQQVVVSQVPRPVVHTSSVSNSIVATTTKVIKTVASSGSNSSSVVTQNASATTNGTSDKMKDEVPKVKIVRDLSTPYVCEWGDCNIEKKFKSANEVFLHACASHCPTGNEEIVCQWDRCDNMKRKRFSLMTHLQDKHCTTEIMKQGLIRRKKAAHSNKPETATSSSTTTTQHPGYAPDAALHAIKRHALEFVNPKELQDDNEGPVTKSIRLTASLILRNLVIYSSHCKRYLKSYESHLANVALSNVESSRTIAQVLYDMNDGSTHR
uniref:Brahma associated protein 170 kD n=1 Tax=Colaphellus bowringi TaxID=561076 RepID=A0A8G0VLU5_9CUCU|nr:Brahma associated protein 170 kD [Colaphellus bowringi]